MGKKRKKKGQSEQTKKPVQPIPLTPHTAEGLKEQFRKFKEKFGRSPAPDDPIFFDPAADEPRPMIDEVIDQHMLEAMHNVKTHPAHSCLSNDWPVGNQEELEEFDEGPTEGVDGRH